MSQDRSTIVKQIKNNGHFKKGHSYGFQKGKSGNPNGRPRKPEIQLFRDALQEVEAEKKTSLFKHAIRKAFEDDNVLIAILRKTVPDMSHVDLAGHGTPHINIVFDAQDSKV